MMNPLFSSISPIEHRGYRRVSEVFVVATLSAQQSVRKCVSRNACSSPIQVKLLPFRLAMKNCAAKALPTEFPTSVFIYTPHSMLP